MSFAPFFPRRACLQVVGHEGGTDDKHKEVVDLHSTGNLLCDAFGLQPNEADFEKSCLKDAVPWLEGVAKKLAQDFLQKFEDATAKLNAGVKKVIANPYPLGLPKTRGTPKM